ncbi:Rgg family transcriptional regulator [Streptococcus castoreus]|uniref:helix-turn-helix domain-containing protein n=1 Tax=Streptococcus castoreus TaxID=254786 RepID=UPI0004079B5F|nr:Rgg/GadR/MutR family transcriptional regulator [Streptococcus castoreus]
MVRQLGKTFRDIRMNRNITLQQIADQDISLSQLSRFERGQSDISLSKFLHALEKMQVEVKEFMDAASDFKKTEQIRFMSTLIPLEYARDVEGFKALQKEEKRKYEQEPNWKRYSLNVILLQGLICKCDPSIAFPKAYLDEVTDYLFSTETWQIYELILIGNLYLFIDIPLLDKMGREILKNHAYYQDIATHKHLVTITLLNILETCLHRNALSYAQFYQEQLKPLLANETKLYEKTIFLFLQGLNDYLSADCFSGIQKMTRAIQIFEALDCPHMVQNYQKDFEHFVNPLT